MQNESLTFTLGQDDCPPELLRSRPPPTLSQKASAKGWGTRQA
jgi:hypothetical protein